MGSLIPDAVDTKPGLDDSGYVHDDTTPKPATDNMEKAPEEKYRGTAELLDLSDDVLLYILRECAPEDLKALGFTCPRLGSLVLDRTLWVDVCCRAASGRRRVRWLLTRALGPHTRRLKLLGYAPEAEGCLGFVNRYDLAEADDTPLDPEEERYLCADRRVFRLAHSILRYSGRHPCWPQPTPSTSANSSTPAPVPPPGAEPESDTCPGPQLTLTHTGLRTLTALCCSLNTLELEECVIDCQTINIGMFPKSLKKLSLRGTKCFNLESKSFLFMIQDHLKNLEELDVSFCAWIEPACMLPLSKMPLLRVLGMQQCYKLAEFVAYASLAGRYGFKKLQVMDLRGSPVGDSEVSSLGWLPNLQELYLSPSPVQDRLKEHAHYSQDTLPKHTELEEWEETEPDYFKPPTVSEEEWVRDEENVDGNRTRYYAAGRDESAAKCILLERMIAEPVTPEEYSQVFQQFLGAHNNNAAVGNQENYGDAYRHYMEPAGYSLFIRRPSSERRGQAGPSRQDQAGPSRRPDEAGPSREQPKPAPEDGPQTPQQPGPSGVKPIKAEKPLAAEGSSKAEKPGPSGAKGALKAEDSKPGPENAEDPVKAEGSRPLFANGPPRPDLAGHLSMDVSVMIKINARLPGPARSTSDNVAGPSAEPSTSKAGIKAEDKGSEGDQEMAVPDTTGEELRKRQADEPGPSGINHPNKNSNEDSSDDDSPPPKRPKENMSPSDNNGSARTDGSYKQGDSAKKDGSDKRKVTIPDTTAETEGPSGERLDKAVAKKLKMATIKSEERRNQLTEARRRLIMEHVRLLRGRRHSRRVLEITINHINSRAHELDDIDERNYNEANGLPPDPVVIPNQEPAGYVPNNARNAADNAPNAVNGANNAPNAANNAPNAANNAPNAANNARNAANNAPNAVNGANNAPNAANNAPNAANNAPNAANNAPNAANNARNAANDDLNRPNVRNPHRFQFCGYRRPIVIEELVNGGEEPRGLQRLPRGLLFSGGASQGPARLDHTSLVTDTSIRRFGRAIGENINYIQIGGAGRDANARPDRSSLRVLSVVGFSRITDAALTHLATAAPDLRRLDVSGTAVTQAGVERFRAMRPDVEVTVTLPQNDTQAEI